MNDHTASELLEDSGLMFAPAALKAEGGGVKWEWGTVECWAVLESPYYYPQPEPGDRFTVVTIDGECDTCHEDDE